MKALLSIVILFAGCSTPLPPTPSIPAPLAHGYDTHTLYISEITLDLEHPKSDKFGIKLIKVSENGSVTIHAEHTDEILEADVGAPFLGEQRGQFNVRAFGNKGLILKDSNYSEGTATFERWFCTTE